MTQLSVAIDHAAFPVNAGKLSHMVQLMTALGFRVVERRPSVIDGQEICTMESIGAPYSGRVQFVEFAQADFELDQLATVGITHLALRTNNRAEVMDIITNQMALLGQDKPVFKLYDGDMFCWTELSPCPFQLIKARV